MAKRGEKAGGGEKDVAKTQQQTRGERRLRGMGGQERKGEQRKVERRKADGGKQARRKCRYGESRRDIDCGGWVERREKADGGGEMKRKLL